MDMMTLKRMVMAQMAKPSELYPVGTDIVGTYIGRDADGYALFDAGYGLDATGEVVVDSGYSTSSVYMPIDPSYRYQKNGSRMYLICFYDANKNFIERWQTNAQTYNNTVAKEITGIPQNARYMRFCSWNTKNANWKITITRFE